MRSARPDTALQLGLVGTGVRYRAPLVLDTPELVEAFEAGRRNRGRLDELTEADRERLARQRQRGWPVLAAYSLGAQRAARAPAPLAVWAVTFAIEIAMTARLKASLPLRHHPEDVALALALVVAGIGLQDVAERHRARRLGLEPITAPEPVAPLDLLMRLPLILTYRRWQHGRFWGSWSPDVPLHAATLIVREFERRRSWRAALHSRRKMGRGGFEPPRDGF